MMHTPVPTCSSLRSRNLYRLMEDRLWVLKALDEVDFFGCAVPSRRPELSATFQTTMARTLVHIYGYISAFCLFLATLAAPPASLVVRTTSGTFKGFSAGNGTEKWLGVPFAQPPVGPLRFKAPVPITNAPQAVKEASTFGNACPQVPSDSLGAPLSEDCLFLNVRSL